MPNTITITVPLTLIVDLDAWATTYGQDIVAAEVPDLVRTHVGELPHIRDEHTLTLEA